MTNQVYTAITFAPVQGFIEKSRKLRDLYGSSYLLSFLAWAICYVAECNDCKVVSPALPNVTQGMPNQIIIQGDFKKEDAEFALNTAWECVTETCREWIEAQVVDRTDGKKWDYKSWKRIWGLWTKYAWEFFWVQGKLGESISDVRQCLNEKKRSRAWTGINWQGESSTLSGADAIAYPGLGIHEPQKYNYQAEKAAVEEFYTQLSQKLGESFIKSVGKKLSHADAEKYGESFIVANEELSIPELVKRLVTHNAIAEQLIERFQQLFQVDQTQLPEISRQIQELSEDLNPDSFKDISRLNEAKYIDDNHQLVREKLPHQGWFAGDGDKAGDYLKSFAHTPEEASKTNEFSELMRNWGKDFKDYFKKNPPEDCRVVYAGGDDFLGVFYETKQAGELKPKRCVDFFTSFKKDVWDKNNNQAEKKPITVSVGFVWAASGVPQRDVLQHCREAEKSAKNNGRDRIAFRVLFNNGNYLEWVCPWWLLEAGLLSSYRDRDGNLDKPKQNWTHIYNDVAILESRHAFDKESTKIALGLLEIYFPIQMSTIKQEDNWWNVYDTDERLIKTGILGDRKNHYKLDTEEIDITKVNKALNDWIINLAKVGFQLCQQ
ncbi:MAG: CRISPR-associated protein [Pelatocladus maniniholoensis HA4357-MV3]|jgi:CRISPR-associated protein Cmr2|uniref:CRISPR-associated protein n=1 Tax=Pelatocladus maniniholoensis HA4357-MV3 TaxID=1117104 RepID=A0A9E3H9E9_9NOST|nr:CRISPR-associated protein [Pelatocladus maniniholoensis HA4357-MV3]